MQPIDFRIVLERQSRNIALDRFKRKIARLMIDPRAGKLIVPLHDIRIKIAQQQGSDKFDILIVSDSASVVDLCYEIVQRLVRNCWLLIEIHLQLHLRSVEVRVHPFIGNVPTYGTVFTTLQNYRVEES
jgi:hypothetical protein